ncbi:MAG: hypothetical protein ABEI58_02975 [Candidatus Nanohaloarchaea archaeon]
MDVRSLMKEWRIWVLLLSLMVSLILLSPHYVQQDDGDVAIATSINKGLDLKGGTRVLLDLNSTNESEAAANQVKGVLETRISAFGLTQTDVRTVRLGDDYKIQVEVANTNRTRLEKLISREGSFESRMPVRITGTENFTLRNPHTFRKTDAGVVVDGTAYSPGDVFYLEGTEKNGTKFVFQNASETRANLEVVMYDGRDVQQVLRSDALVQGSRSGGYSFRFPVVISRESAENVQRVAQNYDTVFLQQQAYLGFADGSPAKLRLYVDGNLQSTLNIAASFKRNVVTQPTISGGAQTAEEARAQMRELQSILESGRLPYPVQIESISTISASLGEEFMAAAFISIVASLIAVGLLVFVRYSNPKIALPIVLTGSSEVFILIGVWFSTVATLDLASIAGIIAAVGTGVDDQIIITDESGREKIRSWKKRMKRAFFVIFTSAASTIGAMMPLVTPEISSLGVGAAGLGLISYTLYTKGTNPHYLVIGGLAVTVSTFAWFMNPSAFALQAVKGFAITTILGVMVGITLTRPAYAKILEELEN